MRAITIQQPWASLIMAGIKTVENRTWATSHRGRLAIHAGRKFDDEAIEILRAAGIDPEPWLDAPRGVVLGTVELTDVVDYASPDLFDPDVRTDPLANPIPAIGALGLWEAGAVE